MRTKLFLVQRYELRLATISKMYCPKDHKTSAVSPSRWFCTGGIGISKTPPCSAVVPYRATICSSTSGVKAGFGCPRLSYRSTWLEAGCYPFPYRWIWMDIILPENDITARPLERAASKIKVASPHCFFWLLPWENVNSLTTLNLPYVSDVISLIIHERNYTISPNFHYLCANHC